MNYWMERSRYRRWLPIVGAATALLLLSLVLLGLPRWVLLFAGIALAGSLRGWYFADEFQAPVDPPDPPPPPIIPVEWSDRSQRFIGEVDSATSGLSFVLSCAARWQVLAGAELTRSAESVVRDLVFARVSQVATLVTVGDPDLATELVTIKLRDDLPTEAGGGSISGIGVTDIQLRVEKDTADRWRGLSRWGQEMYLAGIKREHLDKHVWKSPREALLWHLVQQPDLKNAVDFIDPVRRLLRALDEKGSSADPGETYDQDSRVHPDTPLIVQAVEQAFPDEDGGVRTVFAAKLARLLENHNQAVMAMQVEARFVQPTDG